MSTFSNSFAQDDLQSYIEQVTETNIEGYIGPAVTAFGTAINSGLYHTGKTHKAGGFDITIKGVGVLIPDNDKTFTAEVPSTGNQTWSTIFGPGKDENPQTNDLNPGGLDVSTFPMGVPQISLGVGGGYELMLRFLKFNLSDYGDVSLYGAGVKHNLNRYLPVVPFMPDISLQAAYQQFKAGDIITANSIAFNAHSSIEFLMLSIFGGIGFERTSVDIDYTVNNPQSQYDGQQVSYSFSESSPRLVLGARAKLGLLSVNADINVGKYTAVSAGIGITFR